MGLYHTILILSFRNFQTQSILYLLAGAILSFAFGYIYLNWSLVGEPVLFVLSLLDGCLLIVMALTNEIWVAYAGYWAYRALYQMMITVARYVY